MDSTVVNNLIVILLIGSTLVVGRNIQLSEHDQKPSLSASVSRFLSNGSNAGEGTRWAVLMAGSNGFRNYRHQSDVCHAYQVLKKGGLKDENIIVLMADDIAANEENPHPGVIINRPNGENVYEGVKVDYRGESVTVDNFLNILRGNEVYVTGGTGKVLKTKPNDYIFFYYTGYGGCGALSLPVGPFLFAKDLVETLKTKKNTKNAYKSLLIYIDSNEAGCMLNGLLSDDLDAHAIVATNSVESSYATFCPGEDESGVCLSGLFGTTWMDDIETYPRSSRTLDQHYESIKEIVSKLDGQQEDAPGPSTVMYYGKNINNNNTELLHLDRFFGETTANSSKDKYDSLGLIVDQYEADLSYFKRKFYLALEGSAEKLEASKALDDFTAFKEHIDVSVTTITNRLFGADSGFDVVSKIRPVDQAVVDDWGCLKSMIIVFEIFCGSLADYGMKYIRSFANICNAGVKMTQMYEVAQETCKDHYLSKNPWSKYRKGFSAI